MPAAPLLSFHRFGVRTYELLDWEYRMRDVPALHPEELMEFSELLNDQGVRAFT